MLLPLEQLHHANAIIGGRDEALLLLTEHLESQGVATKGNRDLSIEQADNLSIDMARKLKERQAQKSDTGPKIFVVSANSILPEAQNALLKVFEEPTPYTYFFLVLPSQSLLLPTLRSRLHLYVLGPNKEKTGGVIDFNSFIKLSTSERLEFIKQKTDKKTPESERITTRDARLFLDQLEVYLRDSMDRSPDFELFQEIAQARDFLEYKGSSLKMILEHISLRI